MPVKKMQATVLEFWLIYDLEKLALVPWPRL
jgi:hypothetical protein